MQQLPLFLPESNWQAPTELPRLEEIGATVAIDTEERDDGLSSGRGPGWPYKAGYVCGVSLAWRRGGDVLPVYLPVNHPDTACLPHDRVGTWLKELFASDRRFVFHNAPYDLGWLRAEWDVQPPVNVDDTTAEAVMLDENRESYELDAICKWLGLQGKNEELLRIAGNAYGWHTRKDVKKNLWRMPGRFVGPYAEDDAAQTLQAHEIMKPKLEEYGVHKAYQLECDLIPMVLEMRWRGIRVDLDAAERAIKQLRIERDELLSQLSHHLGRKAEIGHMRQAKWLMQAHDEQGIRYPMTASGKQGSFDSGSRSGWMQKHSHWLPQTVARVRKLEDAASKFVQGYIIDYAHRGRLHASVNQFRNEDEYSGSVRGTRSHRFSYSDPPLQQMPERDPELGPLIRGLFLPNEGELWGAHDYSQQEYRLIVHAAALLKCTRVDEAVRAYHDDPKTDFHAFVSDMTGLDRKPAKDCNFGKAFGAGVPKFAQMIGKTEDEAREIYQQYDREMPFVSEAARACDRLAAQRGFIRLLDGARCNFDLWELAGKERRGRPLPLDQARDLYGPHERLRRAFTHKAFNRYVQGSAARQTKMAMRECWRAGVVPLLQMHDELSCSHGTHAEGEQVAEIMRTVVQLRVPVQVDSEYGTSWGAAKNSWENALQTFVAA